MGLLNENSCLAAALGMTEFIAIISLHMVTHKYGCMVKSSAMIVMNLVKPKAATTLELLVC